MSKSLIGCASVLMPEKMYSPLTLVLSVEVAEDSAVCAADWTTESLTAPEPFDQVGAGAGVAEEVLVEALLKAPSQAGLERERTQQPRGLRRGRAIVKPERRRHAHPQRRGHPVRVAVQRAL